MFNFTAVCNFGVAVEERAPVSKTRFFFAASSVIAIGFADGAYVCSFVLTIGDLGFS